MRVGSPPIVASCLYGVSSPTVEELGAPRHAGTVDLSKGLGADSLGFLALDHLHAIMGRRNDGVRQWCDACFSGAYPVVPPEAPDKDQLPLFGQGEEE